MPVAQAVWAAKRRAELVKQLGGKCVTCHTTHKLEFDHINNADRTWVARDKSRWMRIVLYAREIAQGKIQLLCSKCNKAKG